MNQIVLLYDLPQRRRMPFQILLPTIKIIILSWPLARRTVPFSTDFYKKSRWSFVASILRRRPFHMPIISVASSPFANRIFQLKNIFDQRSNLRPTWVNFSVSLKKFHFFIWSLELRWFCWNSACDDYGGGVVAIWSADYSCPWVRANFSRSRRPVDHTYARQTFHASKSNPRLPTHPSTHQLASKPM